MAWRRLQECDWNIANKNNYREVQDPSLKIHFSFKFHFNVLPQLQMYYLQDSYEDTCCNQEYNDDSSDDRHSHFDDEILTSSITCWIFRFIVGVERYHTDVATKSYGLIVTICYPSLQKQFEM